MITLKKLIDLGYQKKKEVWQVIYIPATRRDNYTCELFYSEKKARKLFDELLPNAYDIIRSEAIHNVMTGSRRYLTRKDCLKQGYCEIWHDSKTPCAIYAIKKVTINE